MEYEFLKPNCKLCERLEFDEEYFCNHDMDEFYEGEDDENCEEFIEKKYICNNCNKEFMANERYNSQEHGIKGNYCSKKCADDKMSKIYNKIKQCDKEREDLIKTINELKKIEDDFAKDNDIFLKKLSNNCSVENIKYIERCIDKIRDIIEDEINSKQHSIMGYDYYIENAFYDNFPME